MPISSHGCLDGFAILHSKLLKYVLNILCLADEGVTEPPKVLGPHAPVLVSKTSDGHACAPDNLIGSVRLPQGHRINHL
jgi:hypothetical protein